MTKSIQQQCADRLYELLPHKKKVPKDLPLPVRYDGISYYWGKNGEMVADFDEGVNTGDGFRIRGWGRIQDEKSQDECAKYIEEAINDYNAIRLADVLLAISEKEKFNAMLKFMAVNGGFYDNGVLIAQYNLAKDNILDQSDEFCEFLYKLIK